MTRASFYVARYGSCNAELCMEWCGWPGDALTGLARLARALPSVQQPTWGVVIAAGYGHFGPGDLLCSAHGQGKLRRA